MKHYYGNYLGICINNQDPEQRGRVQVFIPHIISALYEGWNEQGEDITIECVGDNLQRGIKSEIVERLVQMLPWAEGALPVVGTSVAGSYNESTGNFNQLDVTEGSVGSLPGTSVSLPEGSLGGGTGLDYIFNSEARRDSNGNIQVYNLPSGDGGGSYEVAGINDRYHPQEASALRSLIQQGRYQEAESRAKNYIGTYTNGAARLATNPGSEYAIRDAAFNRGQGGANWMAKYAAGITPSQGMNDAARQQIRDAQNQDPQGFLRRFREASERYERDVVGVRPQFIRGLTNRWDDRLQNSLTLLSNADIDLSDPSSLPPNSSLPAQQTPFQSPESPTYTAREPSQEAIIGTQGAASPAVSQGNYDNFFNSDAFGAALAKRGNPRPTQVKDKRGDLVWKSKDGSGATLCAAGALITAGTITGTNTITTANIGSASKLARSSNNPLTNSGLYAKQTFPSNYVPQNGDVVAMAGGREGYGHALTYLNGKWYAHKSGDNSPQQYLASGKYNSPALYRLTDPEGIDALNSAGIADGSQVIPADPGVFDDSETDGLDTFDASRMVKNTTETQPFTLDTAGMPQGLFAHPAPGALLWVFFREGNPLFPVYFAASYGATEWKNLAKAASPSPYYPSKETEKTEINNQAVIRPNLAGALVFTGTVTDEKDYRTVRMAHANGGYYELKPTGSVIFSPNEHMQHVTGTNYRYCLNNEEWVQGSDNRVTLGNQWVVIGNPSQANIETIEKLSEKVKQINAKMLEE